MYDANPAAWQSAAADQQNQLPAPEPAKVKPDEFKQPEPEEEPQPEEKAINIPTAEPQKLKKKEEKSPEKERLAATVKKIKAEPRKVAKEVKKPSPKPSPKKSPAKKVEPDTVSIPAAQAETPKKQQTGRASVPPAEPETPKKKAQPDMTQLSKELDEVKVIPFGYKSPPGSPTPSEHVTPDRPVSIPPAEHETPRKQPDRPVSIPPGQAATPRRQPNRPVSVPAAEPETPRKVVRLAEPEDDNLSIPEAEPETPKKQPASKSGVTKPSDKSKPVTKDKIVTKPAAKTATPKAPAVKPPSKVVTEKPKTDTPAKKTPAPKKLPTPQANPYDNYKHKARNQEPEPPKNQPRKYGVAADMKREEETRLNKDLPEGKVIPFGYKSPPESPLKHYDNDTTRENTNVSIKAKKPAQPKPSPLASKMTGKQANKNVKSPPVTRKAKVSKIFS